VCGGDGVGALRRVLHALRTPERTRQADPGTGPAGRGLRRDMSGWLLLLTLSTRRGITRRSTSLMRWPGDLKQTVYFATTADEDEAARFASRYDPTCLLLQQGSRRPAKPVASQWRTGPATGRSDAYPDGTFIRRPRPASRTQEVGKFSAAHLFSAYMTMSGDRPWQTPVLHARTMRERTGIVRAWER
jgi:hypothetical protein